MQSNEIRSRYLNYFQKQGHTVVTSDSLVPKNDPTLLFTSAGMVQFKDHFLQRIKLDYTRATSCQKCLRTNDIENVGMTARHHTFFEMLGNFSFGDYFKQDAIRWAWGFIREELGLPEDKLWVTIYNDDDEALKYWVEEAGVKESRIIRLGADSNFWTMGDTGPCGPCSEILVDQGESFSCGKPTCAPGCDCDRYLEIWNLVFTQYDRQADGSLLPLPRKNIDTGAGLERVSAILQKTPSNFETDLLMPIIDFTSSLTSVKYGANKQSTTAYRVIADHSRALTFCFADGVLPSNEGRGYVLRRILRRAYRYGKILGIQKPFLNDAANVVIEKMGDVYPEIREKKQHIISTILAEENRFETTLDSGLSLLSDAIEKAKSDNKTVIPADTVFKLYDTYGFPADLTRDILEESGMTYSAEEYQKEIQHQQERSRAAWSGSGEQKQAEVYKDIHRQSGDTKFVGYEKTNNEGQVVALVKNGLLVDSVSEGDEISIVTSETCFYAESGGQVGDKGKISKDSSTIEVTDTRRYVQGSTVHFGKVIHGQFKKGDSVQLTVDSNLRHDTARNHTATHLLMAALRKVLGEHVEQAGSLVAPDRLRFDFTHFQAVTAEELSQIEDMINNRIQENIPVQTIETDINKAREMGALAFFGEKYGEMVRVVDVKDFDMELCGGTHLQTTGDIGLFLIISAGSIGSGIRRIEAVTGRGAYSRVHEWKTILEQSSDLLKVEIQGLPSRISKLYEENKELSHQVDHLKKELGLGQVNQMQANSIDVKGMKLIVQNIPDSDPKALLTIVDTLKPQLSNTILILATSTEDKVNLVTFVTPDLTKKVQAGKIVGALAKLVGGGGGGRPDLAQAGGKEPSQLAAALEKAPSIVEGFLS